MADRTTPQSVTAKGRKRTGRAVAAALTLAVGLGIGGCGSTPEEPPPTRVDATVTASADVNPDFNGEPSPVFVRVFELKSPGTFNRATFQGLFEKEAETLGADLVSQQTVVLKPGTSSTVAMTFQPGSTTLGVVASFQDIDRAAWRSAAPVTANQTNPFTVSVGRDAVSVKPGGGV